MPNPSDFDSEEKWMGACVPKMMDEGKEQSQAVAACMSMWENKDKAAKWDRLATAFKHDGPGPHDNGSPQSVHAGDDEGNMPGANDPYGSTYEGHKEAENGNALIHGNPVKDIVENELMTLAWQTDSKGRPVNKKDNIIARAELRRRELIQTEQARKRRIASGEKAPAWSGAAQIAQVNGINPYKAVKAVGDWELDVNAIPFDRRDSDNQQFDGSTDILPDVFANPLIVYQHGISQGAKSYDARPVVIGKAVPGSLTKQADGWHIRVVLDKTIKQARDIWEAAKKGLVAVSSGSISHLARLDIGGKMHMYDKGKPGRIAVWPLAEISLWETGNGNMRPANRFAYALPAMKAIYREAGIPFPNLSDTHGALSDANKATRRAKILKQSQTILARANKRKE